MRIDDTDPDELDDNFDDDGRPLRGPGSRRRKLSVLAGAALVLAGGVTAAVTFAGDDSPGAAVSKSTVVESSADTIGPGQAPFPVVGPDPNGFPDYGSDYMGPQLDSMFQRTTDTGIRLVLQNSGDWQNFAFVSAGDDRIVGTGGGVTVATAVAIGPAGAMPPNTGPDQGWTAPAFCNPIGGFRLTMLFKDAIGVANGSRYAEPRDGISVTLFSSGYAEGVPFRALVLNLSDDVISATATWSDDATDTAAPIDGWVVLATPGAASGKFQLVLKTDAGEKTIAWDELPQDGDLAWQKDCSPPPPGLPAAGDQPDDPLGTEAEIRTNFELLYNQDVAFEDKGKQLLDDTTGIQDAIDQMQAGGFADVANTAVHTMTDLVFVSRNEAWFTYDLQTQFGDFPNRFGIAYLIDGQWRIARAVVCQDLALTGIACNPPVNDIFPAVG